MTRSECAERERSGLLARERYELIGGELIRKAPKAPVHNVAAALLMEWLRGVFTNMRVLLGRRSTRPRA